MSDRFAWEHGALPRAVICKAYSLGTVREGFLKNSLPAARLRRLRARSPLSRGTVAERTPFPLRFAKQSLRARSPLIKGDSFFLLLFSRKRLNRVAQVKGDSYFFAAFSLCVLCGVA